VIFYATQTAFLFNYKVENVSCQRFIIIKHHTKYHVVREGTIVKVENNPNIFYMTAGLVTAKEKNEYTYWCSFDGYVYDLVMEIQEVIVDENIRAWFRRAEIGQPSSKPYWPKAFAMQAATYFVDNDIFNFNDYVSAFSSLSVKVMKDPVSAEDFRQWITEVPHVLKYMEDKFAASPAWDIWCNRVEQLKPSWESTFTDIKKVVTDFFAENVPEIIFSPSLLIDAYDTNFLLVNNRMITVAYHIEPENILYGALHYELAKYRDKIKSIDETHPINEFYDALKITQNNYIWDYETNYELRACQLRIIEECFVRGIATILSGGGPMRLAHHANQGFGIVPYIGQRFTELKPKAHQLGDFIDIVLKSFI
jgi:hypothetical protein